MSLNVALFTAISGLLLNQRALDLTAQNVSNVNTEGYSKKIIKQQSVVLDGVGAGVKISEITRDVDLFLLREVRETLSQTSETRALDHFYGRTQELSGAPGSDNSIGNFLASFESTLQALANTPEGLSGQTEVTDRARLMAQRFRDGAADIQTLRLEADREIERSIKIVNEQLVSVEELNMKIAQNIALGREASELQDHRDLAIDKIAEQIDINYFVRDSGEVVIFTAAGSTILDRKAKTLTHDAASAVSSQTVWNAAGTGSIAGILLDGVDITAQIRTGRVKGLIDTRDSVLPDLNSQFGELAYALEHEINAIHNQGTSFPGATTLTGTRQMAGADTPPWTGNVRVAATDASGTVVETQDFDLSTFANVGALVAAVNGMANVSASINANGQVTLSASAGNFVALNELTSAVTVGNKTVGASHFLGLNNFFTSSSDDYDTYLSSQQAGNATALNLTGTLTFSGAFGSTAVAYAAGDDLTTIAANITANGALTAAGISASVVNDGTGYRLKIQDAGGDNFFVTDSGTFLSTLNLRVDAATANATIDVRGDIVNDPSRISRGELSAAATLAAGDIGVTSGGRTVAQKIANKMSERLVFDRVGALGTANLSLAEYGGAIVGSNATQAVAVSDTLSSREFLLNDLRAKASSISGVNLDEEIANTIILENAYSAAARVITTAQQMMDLLDEIVR